MMSNAKVPLSFFIDALAQSIGAAGAKQIFEETCNQAGIEVKNQFSKAEANAILNILKAGDGFLKFVASTLSLRMIWL